MVAPPAWSAARNGMPGDSGATNAASQINQFLVSHGLVPVYTGNVIVSPTGGEAHFVWEYDTATRDFDQPFTMPSGSTTVGRVTIPLSPVNQGADLQVSLCADNGSGLPGTALATTVLPASWINQLAAPLGVTDSSAGPLALAQFNTMRLGAIDAGVWNSPALWSGGPGSFPSFCTSGNYVIMAGGYGASTNSAVNTVTTFEYLGGENLSSGTPQPPLPQGLYYLGLAATSDTLVTIGGFISPSTLTSAVYTAPWNPNTGSIGAWSQQAPYPLNTTNLPTAAAAFVTAAADPTTDTVYGIGGGTVTSTDSTIVMSNEVWYASIQNGQILSWTQGPTLPNPIYGCVASVVNGWLVIAGGAPNYFTPGGISPALNTCYYAQINSDGSLGAWQYGPTMPVGAMAWPQGWSGTATDSTLLIIGGINAITSGGAITETNAVQALTFDENGPGNWTLTNWIGNTINPTLSFPVGDGTWQVFIISFGGTSFDTVNIRPVPTLSVPLPATGLTPGATYHVVTHQQSSVNPNGYALLSTDYQCLPNSMVTSPPGANTWTVDPNNGWRVPITVYDQTAGGQILHTWEDSGARTLTLINSSSTGQLLGLCELTAAPPVSPVYPTVQVLPNPTFTAGTAGWSAAAGTLTQSSAETHGGFPYSGLFTPTGTFGTAHVSTPTSTGVSAVIAGQTYAVDMWLYSPTGWASNEVLINWYEADGVTLAGSSSTTFSLPAATWAHVTPSYVAPANAASLTFSLYELATPPATALLYISNATISGPGNPLYTVGATGQVTTVMQIGWNGAIPTGATQLA